MALLLANCLPKSSTWLVTCPRIPHVRQFVCQYVGCVDLPVVIQANVTASKVQAPKLGEFAFVIPTRKHSRNQVLKVSAFPKVSECYVTEFLNKTVSPSYCLRSALDGDHDVVQLRECPLAFVPYRPWRFPWFGLLYATPSPVLINMNTVRQEFSHMPLGIRFLILGDVPRGIVVFDRIVQSVTNTEQINRAAELAIEEYGKVDILVNNAGASKNAGVLEMTDEEWDFTMEADLTSVFKVTRAFAKYMVEKKYGRIINIASIYGQVGNTAMDTVAYHSSKGGVINFTRAVAAELAKYNITCNAISPGYFETELTRDTLKTEAFTNFMKASVPLGRYGNEGELNPIAVMLASDEASYITGQNIIVDGGYTSI
jgi:NAD(P)-dependent dehydrogenase (short-subunit alcohol dehydrogenase family)